MDREQCTTTLDEKIEKQVSQKTQTKHMEDSPEYQIISSNRNNLIIIKKYITQEEKNRLKKLICKNVLPNFEPLQGQPSVVHAAKRSLVKQQGSRKQIIKGFAEIALIVFPNCEHQIDQFLKAYEEVNYQYLKGAGIILMYTDDTFMHVLLNNILRMSSNPFQIFYTKPIVQEMFRIIKSQHQHDKSIRFRIKQDNYQNKFYRGGKVSEEEKMFFKSNVGKYVETLGFLSTSEDPQVALRFYENIFFEVQVLETVQDQDQDYGYIFLRNLSKNPDEKEVLFNILNRFKIVDVQQRAEVRKISVFLVILKYQNKLPFKKHSNKKQMVKYFEKYPEKKSMYENNKKYRKIVNQKKLLMFMEQEYDKKILILEQTLLRFSKKTELQKKVKDKIQEEKCQNQLLAVYAIVGQTSKAKQRVEQRLLKLQHKKDEVSYRESKKGKIIASNKKKIIFHLKQMLNTADQILNSLNLSKIQPLYQRQQYGQAKWCQFLSIYLRTIEFKVITKAQLGQFEKAEKMLKEYVDKIQKWGQKYESVQKRLIQVKNNLIQKIIEVKQKQQ